MQDAVLAQGAAHVQDDTLVSIDPSDIQKPYAQDGGMPLLAKVWDESKDRVGGIAARASRATTSRRRVVGRKGRLR